MKPAAPEPENPAQEIPEHVSPEFVDPYCPPCATEARAVDTNWHYCRRLADIVIPLLHGKPDAVAATGEQAALHTEAADELSARTMQSRTSRAPSDKEGLSMEDLQQIFGSACPLPADAYRNAEALTKQLVNCPDVQSRLSIITQYTPSKWLLERELEASGWWPRRPDFLPEDSPAYKLRKDGYPDAYEVARCRHSSGLALSGGGIRSATFSLGILQGLARHGRISSFDYLSSVSGGGYIHQFLANWIHKAGDVEKVEALLDPIPNEPGPFPKGGNNTVMPEPLRWLRRYSNYLAPRKGLFSLDPWTIAATWARNTALNLTVLLAGLFCLMLLPHLGTLPIHTMVSHPTRLYILRIVLLAALFVYVVWKVDHWLGDMTPPGPKPWMIKTACASLFLAAALVSPAVYSSAMPGGSSNCDDARRIFSTQLPPVHMHFTSSWQRTRPETQTVEVTVDEKDANTPSRVATGWDARPDLLWMYVTGRKPDKPCFAPREDVRRENRTEAEAIRERITRESRRLRYSVLVPIGLFLLLCGLFFRSVIFLGFLQKHRDPAAPATSIKCEPNETDPPKVKPRWRRTARFALRWILFPVVTLVGAALAWGLVEGLRLVFFVVCFAVPMDLLPSLAVMLLPPLLFGVPYLVMEIALGLVGRWTDSGQREWMARARAFSFLLGGNWGVFTFFSLFGLHVCNLLAQSMTATYSVWGGWVLTTVGGVLAGQSKHTNQNPDGDTNESSKSSTALDLLARVAPLVFVAGLLLLVGTACAWSIHVPEVLNARGFPVVGQHEYLLQREHRFELLLFVSAAVALIFGSCLDINEFSMNPFYRDRLARCYAGAVDPDRKANLFTGFTLKDRCLHMHQLLPENYSIVRQPGKDPVKGTYKGPLPIVCTAINLTTGEDLAYQERKAGSFVFTPLYSGYSVGFTSARDNRNQYNGFVETETYVRNKTGPISMATACAISGAAASPNMGYHTSPAVAFLLTVFNVRLGWWLRNPRRRSILGRTPYPFEPGQRGDLHRKLKCGDLPGSPQGALNLTRELAGMSNDTAPYVYLSDGGHFDNMGLYELLRRRCRTIVICDGEEDGKLTFDGLGMAIRKARLDFGVEVVLDEVKPVPKDWKREEEESWRGRKAYPQSDPNDPGKAAPEMRTNAGPGHDSDPAYHQETPKPAAGTEAAAGPKTEAEAMPRSFCEGIGSFRPFRPGEKCPDEDLGVHCVHGTIRYPEDKRAEQFGHILYIKASLNGDEPADVLNYRRTHENFPHDSTLNQFFTESEFESYRRLGEHIALIDPTVTSWFKRYVDPVTGPKKV